MSLDDTLVARRAIDQLEADCELIVIDPEPRTGRDSRTGAWWRFALVQDGRVRLSTVSRAVPRRSDLARSTVAGAKARSLIFTRFIRL